MRGAWAVAIKELRQIRRDRRTLVILIVVPTFFLFLYGYALNFDIRHVRMAVDDRDGSAESREVVAALSRSTYFDVVATPVGEAEGNALIDRGTARVLLVVPPGFGRTVRAGATAELQVVIDGDNANSATTILGYTSAALRQVSAAWTRVPAASLVTVEPRVWYNPELRSTVFLVPGLIAFISMITAVISTALSIVREKERGTMEQIRMAPVSTLAFVVGKTLPYLVLSQVGATAIILAAMVFFDLPMNGNWLALMVVLAVFLVGALGTGLFVSTMTDSQEMAFQVASLVAMLPTLILSGFIFPISSMPVPLQIVSYGVPARHFLVALRGIVLKGVGLADVWPSLAALAVFGVVVLGLSAVRLARR
jgi:ABC-2 type transport system permease protein